MKVFDVLRSKPGGDELAHRLHSEVRVRALAKLEHTRDLFPTFTNHTISHSEGVIRILDWLLPDDIKHALNAWELYFLLAECYVHDLGMVEGCPGPPDGPDWEVFLTSFQAANADPRCSHSEILRRAIQEFVRETHHLRSEQYVRDNATELGLRASDTAREAQIVARIALGHRKVDLSDQVMFGPVPFGDNQLVHRDLLAAYLRLADELDTTASRTPLAEFHVLHVIDDNAALEWGKHLSLSGYSLEQGVIVLGGECHDHRVYLRLRRLHVELRDKLLELRRMLRRPYATGDEFYVADPLPYHDVDLRVEHVGYLPIDIKFDLQDEEIIKLIMGERLYGDKTACIRELLQNAVDTCQEAREHRPIKWVPHINVTESIDGRIWSFTDNGMGMDEHIVRTYFSRVGISYYRSKEFSGHFRPIGQFGIGFLSCFMLADRIEVESKRDGHEPIKIEITGLTEPFIPSRGTRRDPGTEVRLFLRNDLSGTVDLAERVDHFARHVEIPISFWDREGGCRIIGKRALAPTTEDVLSLVKQDYSPVAADSITEESILLANEFREANGVRVGVTSLSELIVPVWVTDQDQYLPGVIQPNRPTHHLYQNGFYVGPLADPLFGRHMWCVVNIAGDDRFDLTADRSRLAENSPEISERIRDLYANAVESLFTRLVGRNPLRSWWWYHYGSYGPSTGHSEGLIPSRIAESAETRAKWCVLTSSGFHVWNSEQIRSWEGRTVIIREHDHKHLEVIRAALGQEWCVLIWPTWARFDRDFLRIQRPESLANLLKHLGAEVKMLSVDGQQRRFVDMGFATGHWNVSWDWLVNQFGYGERIRFGPIFDARHPLSQLLTSRCAIPLPPRSRLVTSTLFRDPRMRTSRRMDVTQHLLTSLREDGIIEDSFDLEEPSPTSRSSHRCPYR